MPTPRVLILRAPGTNCDQETGYAFELAGAAVEPIHINRLLDEPRLLDAFQVLCVPGGFSYGDDLSAGRILGNQFRFHLAERLREFTSAEKLVLGICNGFQMLMKSGLLVAPLADGRPAATLTFNASGKFEARWIRLTTTSEKSVFFRGIESLELPVAHAEGKFVPASPQALADLEGQGRVVLRYAAGESSRNGQVDYPDNPNGSIADIAAICDATGRVCGLMPHPERNIDPTHHPQWTRRARGEGDGLKVFRNAVEWFR